MNENGSQALIDYQRRTHRVSHLMKFLTLLGKRKSGRHPRKKEPVEVHVISYLKSRPEKKKMFYLQDKWKYNNIRKAVADLIVLKLT